MSISLREIFQEVSPIVDKVFSSYRDKGNLDNGSWLTGVFASHEATEKDATWLSKTIQSTVGRFSENMRSVDTACKQRETKAEWLKDFIRNNTDLRQEEKQRYLAQVDAALRRGNEVMVNFIIAPTSVDITQEESPSVDTSAQWNRYTTLNDIAQQSVLMGSNGVQIFIDQNAMEGEEILQEDITAEEIGTRIDEGIKMAMAAGIKIGQATGKISCLPNNTPITAIVDIACVGVEIAKNIGRAAMGKIRVSQAIENIGRASIVAIADFCTTGIPAMVLVEIPVVGPVLSTMCAGYLVSRSPKEIQQRIYEGIERVKPTFTQFADKFTEAVQNARNTVTERGRRVLNTLMNPD